MPVLPVAPGELTTGNDTLRSSSISLPALRASWSAPPPGPHGTMNSIGRDGYFSCACATSDASATKSERRKCLRGPLDRIGVGHGASPCVCGSSIVRGGAQGSAQFAERQITPFAAD